jgi:hypothetical protein
MPCSLLSCNQRFGGAYCLNLQGRWWWRRYVPPKRQLQLNRLHGVISQKITLFITTTVETSNPTWWILIAEWRPHTITYAQNKLPCTVYSWLSMLMKEKRRTNNNKTWITYDNQWVILKTFSETYAGPHGKWPWNSSHIYENWSSLINFHKIHQYQISWKFLQWFSSSFICTERQKDEVRKLNRYSSRLQMHLKKPYR